MKNIETEIIGIQERFIPVDVRSIDSKNRITLGDTVKKKLLDKMDVDAFKIFIGDDGDILLRAVVNIPSKEAWFYKNSAALKEIRRGLEDASKEKREKVVDLDNFLKKL